MGNGLPNGLWGRCHWADMLGGGAGRGQPERYSTTRGGSCGNLPTWEFGLGNLAHRQGLTFLVLFRYRRAKSLLETQMKAWCAVCVLALTVFPANAQQQSKAQVGIAGVLESKVRKAWEDYKTKNKADLATLLADDFRIIQDGDAAFGDKKADVEEVDTLNVRDYSLSNFTVTPIGKDGALVTYFAEFTMMPSGQEVHGKIVVGEVWVKSGTEWKAIYAQGSALK